MLHLYLSPGIRSEKVEIQYVLYGAFGAHGSFAKAEADSALVEIPLSVGGQVAEEAKGFAWVPGCRVRTFDLKVKELDLQWSYVCESSSDILLSGRVKESRLLHKGQPTEIEIDYLADWACDFFGFADCMVPQFLIGIATLDPAGRFTIQLPDFASDPVCLGSRLPSGFELTLRETRTKNRVAALGPESRTLRLLGGELKATSVYPNPAWFIASEPK